MGKVLAVIVLSLCILVITACSSKGRQKTETVSLSFDLKVETVSSVPASIYENAQVFASPNGAFLVKRIGNQFIYISCTHDTIVALVEIPDSAIFLRRFKIFSNGEILLCDHIPTFFYFYDNMKWERYEVAEFTSEYRPIFTNRADVLYLRENKKLVFIIGKTNKEGFDDHMNGLCLGTFDLTNYNFHALPLKYPEIYADRKIREPEVYLSDAKNYFLVSFSHCHQLFLIEKNGFNFTSHNLFLKGDTFPDFNKFKAVRSSLPKKQITYDFIQSLVFDHHSYFSALYDESTGWLYRLCESKKFKLADGSMPKHKRLVILAINLLTKDQRQIELPLGFYFQRRNWTVDAYFDRFIYYKLNASDRNEKRWESHIHYITPFEFH